MMEKPLTVTEVWSMGCAEVGELKAKLARYEKALRFYADQKKYSICAAVYQFPDIVYDDGETARETLKEDRE